MSLFFYKGDYKKRFGEAESILTKQLNTILKHINLIKEFYILDNEKYDEFFTQLLFDDAGFVVEDLGNCGSNLPCFVGTYVPGKIGEIRINKRDGGLSNLNQWAKGSVYLSKYHFDYFSYSRRPEKDSVGEADELTRRIQQECQDTFGWKPDSLKNLITEEVSRYGGRKDSFFSLESLPMLFRKSAKEKIRTFFKNTINPLEEDVCRRYIDLLETACRQNLRRYFNKDVWNRISDTFIDSWFARQTVVKEIHIWRGVGINNDSIFSPNNKRFPWGIAYLSCFLLANPDVVLSPNMFKNWESAKSLKSLSPLLSIEEATYVLENGKNSNPPTNHLPLGEIIRNNDYRAIKELIFNRNMITDSGIDISLWKEAEEAITESNKRSQEEREAKRKQKNKREAENRFNRALRRVDYDEAKNAIQCGLHVYYLEYSVVGRYVDKDHVGRCFISDSLKEAKKSAYELYRDPNEYDFDLNICFSKTLIVDDHFIG